MTFLLLMHSLQRGRIMKSLLFLMTFLPIIALSHTELHLPMKKMGQNFKVLTLQAGDINKNESSISLAQEMLSLVKQSRDIMPDTVASLPEPERSKAFVEFQDTLDLLQSQLIQLIESFKTADNKKAVQLISSMSETKKSGHEKFKD
jgi:hypothetical protein